MTTPKQTEAPKLLEIYNTAETQKVEPKSPEALSKEYKDQGADVVSDMLPKKDLYALGCEKLSAYFIKDSKVDKNGSLIGTFDPHGNSHFERWIGLKNIIPKQYTEIKVTKTNGETESGERHANGSFYTKDGKYIEIWKDYSFEAKVGSVIKKEEAQTKVPSKSPVVIDKMPDKEPTKKSLDDVVAFGDSITEGMGKYLGEEGADVKAFSGQSITGKIGKEILAYLKNPTAKTISILVGANDVDNGKSVEAITKKLDEVYTAAHKAGLKVVACTLTPWDKDPAKAAKIDKINAWIKKCPNVDKVVDLYDAMRKAPDSKTLGVGRLHPTRAGSEYISKQIAKIISENANFA